TGPLLPVSRLSLQENDASGEVLEASCPQPAGGRGVSATACPRAVPGAEVQTRTAQEKDLGGGVPIAEAIVTACRDRWAASAHPTRHSYSPTRYLVMFLRNMFLSMGPPVKERRPVGGNWAPCRSAWGKLALWGKRRRFRENCSLFASEATIAGSPAR